ncbi:DUF7116 family protein [Halocalculus aciditolerans]|uniref:Uncharacterized protein n=1 Tax=Halocalculus aciditolerans TaxID=1383812 RepID=A0A830FGD9_9EURY|nr:hypothetical protein [Halocalculus aciditolerans]GGL52986.1 hypothetical protein GCM10009039_08970 [Halocalculus aciditolerans]
MVAHTTPPAADAKTIFTDLGYDVVGDGPEFRATRDWKEVTVRAVADDATDAPDADLQCYVTWSEHAPALQRRLDGRDCDEWAVIGVDDDGGYEVTRAPPAERA